LLDPFGFAQGRLLGELKFINSVVRKNRTTEKSLNVIEFYSIKNRLYKKFNWGIIMKKKNQLALNNSFTEFLFYTTPSGKVKVEILL